MTEVEIQVVDARAEYLQNRKIWFHAMLEGRIVGMASLDMELRQWGWINDLFVDPFHRRQRIGWQLVGAVGDWVQKETKAFGICCGIEAGNFPSTTLFRHLSYRHVYSYPEGGSYLFSLSLGRDWMHHEKDRHRATNHV